MYRKRYTRSCIEQRDSGVPIVQTAKIKMFVRVSSSDSVRIHMLFVTWIILFFDGSSSHYVTTEHC